MRSMTPMTVLAAIVSSVLLAPAAGAQVNYVNGVFIGTPDGPVELIAYAESMRNGRMQISGGGSLDDVPEIDSVQRILCSLPNWQPVAVWMASARIFRDEYAERRLLPLSGRKLNVYTTELRVSELESRERVDRLIRSVRATEDEVPYVFVHVNTGGVERHYMARLRSERP